MVDEFSFKIANGSNRIKATTICMSNKVRKLLSQLLKKPDVFLFNRHKNANGESKISIFVNIYLRVNVITKLKEEIEIMLVRIPSIEKILKFELDVPLSSLISEEKEIFLLKIFPPSSQIKFDIS